MRCSCPRLARLTPVAPFHPNRTVVGPCPPQFHTEVVGMGMAGREFAAGGVTRCCQTCHGMSPVVGHLPRVTSLARPHEEGMPSVAALMCNRLRSCSSSALPAPSRLCDWPVFPDASSFHRRCALNISLVALCPHRTMQSPPPTLPPSHSVGALACAVHVEAVGKAARNSFALQRWVHIAHCALHKRDCWQPGSRVRKRAPADFSRGARGARTGARPGARTSALLGSSSSTSTANGRCMGAGRRRGKRTLLQAF